MNESLNPDASGTEDESRDVTLKISYKDYDAETKDESRDITLKKSHKDDDAEKEDNTLKKSYKSALFGRNKEGTEIKYELLPIKYNIF